MRKTGFTLVELSIVLVIIGLIVGGVLVGRDLIRAAEVRKQIKQIEDLETQLNTFRLKYNCMAGDCQTITGIFGTTDASGNTILNGDGNGIYASILDPASVASPYTGNCMSGVIGSELSQLFLHLKLANISNFSEANGGFASFPPAQLGGNIMVTCLFGGTPTLPAATMNIVIGASIMQTNLRVVYSVGASQYTNPAYNGPAINGMPLEAVQQVDMKLDDNIPNTGKFGVVSSGIPVSCLPSASSYSGISNTPGCFVSAAKILTK